MPPTSPDAALSQVMLARALAAKIQTVIERIVADLAIEGPDLESTRNLLTTAAFNAHTIRVYLNQAAHMLDPAGLFNAHVST